MTSRLNFSHHQKVVSFCQVGSGAVAHVYMK